MSKRCFHDFRPDHETQEVICRGCGIHYEELPQQVLEEAAATQARAPISLGIQMPFKTVPWPPNIEKKVAPYKLPGRV